MSEIQRYAVIETALCIGGNVHDGEVLMIRADEHDRELTALREELAKSQERSVTNIMMDVVPGLDGMGEEIYAKSAAEVQLLISNLYLKTEELGERLTVAEQRNASLLEIARGLTIQLHATIGNTELHDDCVRDLVALEAVDAKD